MANRKEHNKKQDDRILFAFLAAFLSVIGFVIALIVKRNDKYVMYYAKHSLIIFIIIAVSGVVAKILTVIPIIGLIIYAAVTILSIVLWILSWMYALTGKEKIIPIVTDLAKKITL